GSGQPQHVRVRYSERPYSDTRRSLEYSDAPPEGASETPLLWSAVPRRSGQAYWKGSPLGDVQGYVALSSRPISVGGDARRVSDPYAGRLRRSVINERLRATLYGGYTHEELSSLDSVALQLSGTLLYPIRRSVTYGGMASLQIDSAWSFLGDVATVHHRAN